MTQAWHSRDGILLTQDCLTNQLPKYSPHHNKSKGQVIIAVSKMEAGEDSSPRLCAPFTLNTDEIGWSLSEWGIAVKRGVFVNEDFPLKK